MAWPTANGSSSSPTARAKATSARVAADATPLVRTFDDRAAFARYEHLVDAYMTRHAFSAMCAYNRSKLDRDAVARST
jgi:hypothetical protein